MIDFRVRKTFSVACDTASYLAMLNEEDPDQNTPVVTLTQDTCAYGSETCIAFIMESKHHNFKVGFVFQCNDISTVLLVGRWDQMQNMACMTELVATAKERANGSPFWFASPDAGMHLYQFLDEEKDPHDSDDNPIGDFIWKMAQDFGNILMPAKFTNHLPHTQG